MFSVWAPEADTVELEMGGRRVPMEKAQCGWWRAKVDAKPGVDYAYCINGGPPRPDPRSPWQPQGSDGPSRTVDHSAFAWTDHGFQQRPLASAIMYEMHIGAFTPEGTFDAAIERLEHLHDLGVTHIALMPVTDSPGNFCWGYDNVNLFAVRHEYGGPDGLRRFVNAAHGLGMAVLVDVVYNHIGPRSNYLPEFGPYFSEEHVTKWGPGFNVDREHSDEVRRFLCDNAIMWLRDYHCDGLRVDSVDSIMDNRAIPFLEQLTTEVKHLEAQLGRHFCMIAESSANNPRMVQPPDQGGMGFHAHWSNDFQHALHALLTGERFEYYKDYGSVEMVATVMKEPYIYAERYAGRLQRHHGRHPHGLPPRKFVVFASNHDHAGNRKDGARLATVAGLAKAKIAAALLLTSPYVPMLFMGDEWAASTPFYFFADHREDPELAEKNRAGRIEEFPEIFHTIEDVKDPSSPETFEESKLDWKEVLAIHHADMLDWHRKLIALRHRVSGIVDMKLTLTRTSFDEEKGWLCVQRGDVIIACNFSHHAQAVPIPQGQTMAVVLASQAVEKFNSVSITLAPESVAILKVFKEGEPEWV